MTNQLVNGHLFNLAVFVAGLYLGSPLAVLMAFLAWGFAYLGEAPEMPLRGRIILSGGVVGFSVTGAIAIFAGMLGTT